MRPYSTRIAKVVAKRRIKEVEKSISKTETEYFSSSNTSEEDSEDLDSSNSSTGEVENRVHGRRFRQRTSRNYSGASSSSSEESVVAGEGEYYVDKILDVKFENGKTLFFVKWLNFSDEANSWEPIENMAGSLELIRQFMESRKLSMRNKSIINEEDIPCKKPKIDNSNKISVNQNITLEHKHIKQPLKVGNGKNTDNEVGGGIKSSPPRVVFIIRVWVNEQVHLLYLDITDDKEEYYNVVLTEDILGKDPDYVYGTAEAVDGSQLCLVQFKGHEYIDVVPISNLCKRFPGMIKYLSKCLKNKKST